MKLFSFALIYLALSTSHVLSTDSFIVNSPNEEYFVELRNPQTTDSALWVVSKANSSDAHLLCNVGRAATPIIASSGDVIAINTAYSSTDSTVILFKRVHDLIFKIYGEQDIAALMLSHYRSLKHFDYDHWYVEAIAWSPNERSLLLKAHGTSGKSHLVSWFSVYGVEKKTFSQQLDALNR